MALKLTYLMLTRLAAWMVLLTRSQTTNQVEILVLRHPHSGPAARLVF